MHPDLQASGEGKFILLLPGNITSVCLHFELLEDETLSGEGRGKWIMACGKTCCLAQQLCPFLLPTKLILYREAECWVSV